MAIPATGVAPSVEDLARRDRKPSVTSRPRKAKITLWSVIKTLLFYAMLIFLAVGMLLPFLWMITTSLEPPGTAFSYPPKILPTTFDLTSYRQLFTLVPFARYFLNTLIVTAATVVGQTIFCSTAAYAFARLQFIGRKALFILFLATMMIPFQVTMIPLFLMVFQLGWVNTYFGLIGPGISSAFGIFLLRQAFLTIPRDYQDAARIDGASEWTVFFRIFLPLTKPALATVGVFSFMGTWNDLLWPLLVSRDEEHRTLELGLAYFNASASAFQQPNWPLMMAAAVVVLVPVLAVYIFAQRYFVAGISLSGVK
ncbi:carbohydrate ABC transporter permease [Microlunatus panaciterrae]|uniref:Multiple sugar transport system permease protein n=1 Tax=Microlunatus panaciterrae TaxID=400768 RepID=A0ABS2RNR9_9ACTN|nr:carbohydrate ABC transporter permease [Microlunatus panaciterrae]MBM7800665.1 multiple sugar transport system permease protein [Microlunatus panaciterrae]